MTSTAFAVAADLGVRLKRTFDADETAQVDQLLLDASDHLRAEIGQLITAGTLTFTASVSPHDTWIDLPQLPVRALTSVTVGGVVSTAWELRDQALELRRTPDYSCQAGYGYGPLRPVITITYDYGFTTVPGELRSWAIVLAAQALAQVEAHGSIGSAGLQSERIDDYATNFATTGAGAEAFSIPEGALERLRARYGRGAYVTGARR